MNRPAKFPRFYPYLTPRGGYCINLILPVKTSHPIDRDLVNHRCGGPTTCVVQRMHDIVCIVRKVATTFASILLFAIALFVIGPRCGSVDIDGDGVPDVPIVVMHGSNHSVRYPQSDGQTKVDLATASPFLGSTCNAIVLMKARIVVGLRGCKLDSVVPLRC